VPLVFIRDAVVFPDVIVELHFNKQKCIDAVRSSSIGERVVIVTQKNLDADDPISNDFYGVGVVGKIVQMNDEFGYFKVIVESENRVNINSYLQTNPFFIVKAEKIIDDKYLDDQGAALKNLVLDNLKKVINSGKIYSLDMVIKLLSIDDPNRLINNLLPILDENIVEKQKILEIVDINSRLKETNTLLARNLKVTEIEQSVAEKTQEELAKTQKEAFLREELKTIQKELGETEGNEFEALKRRIETLGMPQNIKEIAQKELTHLQKTPSFSPEISYIRNYLDLLLDLPWQSVSDRSINLEEARRILDEDHYGLDKVKQRILEYLAVLNLAKKTKSPILCFVGPPGTGKTSIGKSIARALGRKFHRLSLGGIRDEAEIRGHRRTYVGAMPGRVIQGIKQIGTKNPVFMLDEIDKIGSDFRGDPSAALLETLDPEQNFNFSDHYLEVPYDLSEVIFITTANVLENIPRPLQDRMEVIEFPGYSPEEKFNIAKKFILPKILENHGLKKNDFEISDDAVYEIISSYTAEAGVRNLEREFAKIARKIALLKLTSGSSNKLIGKSDVVSWLGLPKVESWIKEIKDTVGLVAALAVTEGGGDVLSIEATLIPDGKGNLTLTGHLGEVMKESAQTAFSFAKSVLPKFLKDHQSFSDLDIHVHVPMGAIPKDGPSAGVAISTAILSALIQRPIDAEIGMTGEVTLRGRVLKIGGLKEKILAAKRAGLKKVFFPYSNRGDFEEIPPEYKTGVEFYPIKMMDELLPLAFKEVI